MRKVIIGISAAIALLFIGTLDADAARIEGNFCCGVGGHRVVCCSRTGGCHAECPRVHSAVSSMAHGIVRAPPRSQPVNRQACLHTEKRVSKIFGFSIETTSLRSAFYLCRGFDARVL
jgi:hypothetical protein